MTNITAAADDDLNFDYSAAAEFVPRKRRRFGHRPLHYRRFAEAAEAIRFAIEEVPPELLLGCFIEAGEERYDHERIRRLYDSAEYPLARQLARPA